MLDENGNKIKALGTDGKDGDNGSDGEDGADGKNGTNGDSFFQSVTWDEVCVFFTLAAGTVISVPLSINTNEYDDDPNKIYYTTLMAIKFPHCLVVRMYLEPTLFITPTRTVEVSLSLTAPLHLWVDFVNYQALQQSPFPIVSPQ